MTNGLGAALCPDSCENVVGVNVRQKESSGLASKALFSVIYYTLLYLHCVCKNFLKMLSSGPYTTLRCVEQTCGDSYGEVSSSYTQ